ncbi:unnamed protein product [Porites evermanni]|uniref:Uncharacterized protein n=1 Tax=Porites evermanni TaxID=104178 RepID=A0ABN8PFB5_9CNID|nr:unnamed protein product [Porites evermanni]
MLQAQLLISSFTPQRFNKNTSMLDLLGNSSFAEHLTSLHSPKLSLQASIPSSTVGSLLSHCLAIIGEPNHLQDKTSPSSVSKNVDLDIEIISKSWLVYCEGEGMFYLLCCGYITKNKYNKQNTFNLAPFTNYKHSAVSDHARGSGHTSTVIFELERRNSSLAKK